MSTFADIRARSQKKLDCCARCRHEELFSDRYDLIGWLHRGMEAVRGQANLRQSNQGPFQKSMRVLLDEIEGG